ncbi:hypothetical protein M378DRAFT_18176 [Amanita muscaria Koide BX008]|uniref:Uncharacterized protein n=1 Tax=Amanita muscaria (strain Koide BX008) TaxID=946122 RepID=A0A0C2RXY5_AMAMK|nr:hypothetical protein M378DRAFT_18176 [Amanita muscaria Koide BX008]
MPTAVPAGPYLLIVSSVTWSFPGHLIYNITLLGPLSQSPPRLTLSDDIHLQVGNRITFLLIRCRL